MVRGDGDLRIGPADSGPAGDPSRAPIRTGHRRRRLGFQPRRRPGGFRRASPARDAPRRCASLPSPTKRILDTKHSAEELAKNLARHGIDVVLDKVDADGRPIGEVLEAYALSHRGRRPRDGRLRPLAMARIHPGRRDQEPVVQATAPDPVFALTGRCSGAARRGDQMAEDTNTDNPVRN